MAEIESDRDEETFQRIREERQREVDQISLELLSNTKHYKKYIAKKCPEEQLKRTGESHRFLKYKSRIAAMFIEMLDEYGEEDEDEETPSDLQSIFAEMVQKTIQHLEWKEYSRSDNTANEFDDDMMFANTGFQNSNFTVRRTNKSDPYSYWGATIRKNSGDDGDR
jgi:hypothetical protein